MSTAVPDPTPDTDVSDLDKLRTVLAATANDGRASEFPVLILEFFAIGHYRGFDEDGDPFGGFVLIESDSPPHHLEGMARVAQRHYESETPCHCGGGNDDDD